MIQSTYHYEPLRLARGTTEADIISLWQGADTRPLVTVICHAYNHAEHIAEAIESFLAQQTSFSFEILIHDDASTDGTSEIVQKYAESFPGIIRTIIQEKNQFSQGYRPPRYTYRKAAGQYIALCEGDDYWTESNKLAKQVALLEKYPDVDLCVHRACKLSIDAGAVTLFGDHGEAFAIKDVADPVGGPKHYAPTASYVFRTSQAVAMPDWFFNDPLPFGDYFIEALIGRKGILYMPDVMSVYRHGVPGSHSDRHRRRGARQLAEDYENYRSAVERLRQYEDIPASAIDEKIGRLNCEYAWIYLDYGLWDEFRKVVPSQKSHASTFRYVGLQMAARSKWSFQCATLAIPVMRKIKLALK